MTSVALGKKVDEPRQMSGIVEGSPTVVSRIRRTEEIHKARDVFHLDWR